MRHYTEINCDNVIHLQLRRREVQLLRARSTHEGRRMSRSGEDFIFGACESDLLLQQSCVAPSSAPSPPPLSNSFPLFGGNVKITTVAPSQSSNRDGGPKTIPLNRRVRVHGCRRRHRLKNGDLGHAFESAAGLSVAVGPNLFVLSDSA